MQVRDRLHGGGVISHGILVGFAGRDAGVVARSSRWLAERVG